MSTSTSTKEKAVRQANDFYPTPAWVTEGLLDKVDLGGIHIVVEPCAGVGSICEVVAKRHHVVANELQARFQTELEKRAGQVYIGDWLDVEHRKTVLSKVHPTDNTWLYKDTAIITNPPYFIDPEPYGLKGKKAGYKLAMDFIEACLTSGCRVVCLLMRLGMLASQGRHAFWKKYPLTGLCVLNGRPSYVGGGTDKYAYAWYTFDMEKPLVHNQRLCTIDHILKPGNAR